MTRLIIPALAVLFAGCGSKTLMSSDGAQGGAALPPSGTGGGLGRGTASGGAGGDGGAAGDTGGSDGGAPMTAAGCVEQPAAKAGADARITVNVELSYAGQPVAFGQPIPLQTGTLTVTNFRFYVSSPMLTPAVGDPVPADLIGGDGVPVPYNVVLVNAENPSGLTFQVAAPAGTYQGVSFLVGVPDVCNTGLASSRSAALSYESQMTWPPPFGYLFLRYAGKLGDGAATDATPSVIDMGGFPGKIFAPRAIAPGSFVAGGSTTVRLRVALDELFRAESMPAELDDAGKALTGGPTSGTAQLAGQHVLQNIQAVSLFTVAGGL